MRTEKSDGNQMNGKRAVIAVIQRQNEFLVIRRSETVRAPNQLCFPGGEIESGETDSTALVREMMEELHLPVIPKRLLWTSVAASGCHLRWWVATLEQPDAFPKANPEEVKSWHWMTVAQIEQSIDALSSLLEFVQALRAQQFDLADFESGV